MVLRLEFEVPLRNASGDTVGFRKAVAEYTWVRNPAERYEP